ncbi:MAG: hypothetical protein COA58_06790 [Bacteroidetes bacterium]|nr:MAG: hypothetical protein COA58_06790 [Bacteroidota bacterium]
MKNKMKIDNFFREKLSTLDGSNAAKDWKAMEQILDADKGTGFWQRNKYASILLLLLFICTIGFFTLGNKTESDVVDHEIVSTQNDVSTYSPRENTNEIIATNNISTLVQDRATNNDANEELIDEVIDIEESILEVQDIDYTVSDQDPVISLEGVSTNPLVIPRIPILDMGGVLSAELVVAPNLVLETRKIILLENLPGLTSRCFQGFEMERVNETSSHTSIPFIPKTAVWFYGVDVYGTYNVYNRDKRNANAINSEKEVSSIGYGLGGFVGYKRWKFKLGVGQLNLREKNNYIGEMYDYTYDTSFVLVKRNYNITSHGKTTALVKEIINSTVDTSSMSLCQDCKTTFSYIEIPMSIQYEVGKSRLRCFGEIGVGLSFLQKAKGYYSTAFMENAMSENGGTYRIAQVQKEDVNKMLWSTKVALGIKYRLTKELSLYSSYEYTMYRTSMMTNYDQMARLNKAKLGIEYRF